MTKPESTDPTKQFRWEMVYPKFLESQVQWFIQTCPWVTPTDMLVEKIMDYCVASLMKKVHAFNPSRGDEVAWTRMKLKVAIFPTIRRELRERRGIWEEEGIEIPFNYAGADKLEDMKPFVEKREDMIEEALNSLAPSEAYCIREIIMQGRTQIELAKELGVSRHRIYLLLKEGIAKLKATLSGLSITRYVTEEKRVSESLAQKISRVKKGREKNEE